MLSRADFRLLCVLLLALLLAAGCLKQIQAGTRGDGTGSGKGVAQADAQGASAEAQSQLSAGVNQLALRLYEQVSPEPGNLFFSPYSLTTALSMVYEGAAGPTADEIQSVLQVPAEAAQRQSAVAAMHNALNPRDAPYQLAVANGVWAQQDYPFLPEYLDLLKRRYASEAANLDFRTQSEPARQQINQWVAQRTKDKIPELFEEGLINPDTRMVLANAIYFKGRWARQFDPERSFDREFRTPAGPVQAKFMLPAGVDRDYAFFEDDRLKAVELPYEGERLALLILLPQSDDLAALEDSLSTDMLAAIAGQLVMQDLILQIPRFTFRSKFSLADTLSAMGMPTAFLDTADFSGMTGGRDLKIAAVVHQAFVEVNEEGTEAAAATGITMAPTSAPMDPRSFIADHPFLFFIRDKVSGAILFMGRVEDPTAK